MSDVTEAVAQDAVAESLLGDQTEAVEQTEQSQTGTEAVEQTEQVEAPDGTEQQTAEETEDWLPSDQDKIFPDTVYAKYAERYQFTPEQAADPLIRQLLHDKINSDILIRQQQELEQNQEFQVEEPQQEPTQQQPQQPQTLEQHMQALQQWADQNTDPRLAQNFANSFMSAFGVKEAASPETARALTQTMTTFGMNLLQTALPQMIMPLLDMAMPGISGMFYQGSRAQSWDQVRNSSPAYATLPAYGTKEFMELAARLDSEYPALTEMGLQMERAGGGQLYGPSAAKFYGTMAKLASKQNVDPNLLLQAAQAGARNARRAEVTRNAGNLGAGQSKGMNNRNAAPKSPFQSNTDLFDDEMMAELQRRGGSL